MIFYNYNQVRTFIILLAGIYLMFLPALAGAKIIINEIMYDPEGADTGREWIEVYNSGTDDLDLATYKLFENNVAHKLTLVGSETSSIIKSKGFAILADNPEKFLIDFPNFSGHLFDSAFSLNNTGEILVINDAAGSVIDNFEYTADLGAGDNGNSLQRNDAGFWIEAGPTISMVNKNEVEKPADGPSSGSTSGSGTNTNNASTTSTTSTTNSNSTHSGQNTLTKYVTKSLLEIGAGRNRFGSLNTPLDFQAEYNTEKKPRFMWAWGDGSSDMGHKNSHIYEKPGVYNVVLNAILNGYQATARTKVTISDISVDILYITYGKVVDIMLKNRATSEVNLGGFVIKTSTDEFEISTDTIIDAKSEIIIPAKHLNFEFSTTTDFTATSSVNIKLYYPDGSFYKFVGNI